ncbi:MAG: hypothetical protein ACOVS5_03125 [Oligoflexus sp.]
MLYVLDESLASQDFSNAPLHSGIELLLYSAAQGKHVVAANPEIVRHLLNFRFSSVPRAMLLRLQAIAPELMAHSKNSRFRVRVVSSSDSPRRVSISEWVIPLQWIHEHGVPTSALMGEDVGDAEVYKICGQHHAALSRKGLTIHLDLLNGGGAASPRVLQNELMSRNRLVLCITDSDRCYPGAEANKTSKDCQKLVEGSDWVAAHISLDERELENILPRNIVDDAINDLACQETNERKEVLGRISRDFPEAWGYFDFKEGTPLRLSFGAGREYWRPMAKHQVCLERANKQCLASESCTALSRAECKCLIAPSLSNRLVEHVKEFMTRQSRHEGAKRARTSANGERWLALGAVVAEWGAALPKARS